MCIEIWQCLNGMENSATWEARREYRTRLEKLLAEPKMPTKMEGKAYCLDCSRDYDDFGLDVLLPRWQWLIIHPDENGLLCAQCIVTRASKIAGVVGLEAVIGIKPSDPLAAAAPERTKE